MNHRDWAYWFQGAMELAEPRMALSKTQVECIRKHIELVKVESEAARKKRQPSMATLTLHSYMSRIEGHLDALDRTDDLAARGRVTDLIRETLAMCFEHVIDKGYEAEKGSLDQAHHGDNSDITYRC